MIVIPEMDGLTFDSKAHVYSINGIPIPSVTQLMKPLSDSEYGGIDPKHLEIAAARGTAVHEAIENYIKFGIMDIPPEFHGYVDGFQEWWASQKPTVVASELRFYHKYMWYGGTADLLAEINGKLSLIDFKTTSKVIHSSCAVQLEAYARALESHGIEVQEKYILHLKNDGRWAFLPFRTNDTVSWSVFSALKAVYNYIQNNK